MAKKTRISAEEYRPVKDAFCNARYEAPGVLARVLLEAFIYENGDINADWFVREKACRKGRFTAVRDRLVADGWLLFREDTKRYFAGSRLTPHVERVREVRTATLADLDRIEAKKADKTELEALDARKVDRVELEMRLADTNKRIHEIAVAVKELQEAMLPPDSDDKKLKREKSASKIARLSQAH